MSRRSWLSLLIGALAGGAVSLLGLGGLFLAGGYPVAGCLLTVVGAACAPGFWWTRRELRRLSGPARHGRPR